MSKKNRIQISTAWICTLFLIICTFAGPALAEGSSASVSLQLNKTVLNIGKTFILSLKAEPNAKLAITSFDATIRYDTTKFDLVKDGDAIKITKPAAVPSGFRLDATVTGGDITILGTDETVSQNAPINATVATSLITLTFRVKDNAALGNTAFTISDCTINKLENASPVSVPLTLLTPRTASVAARLETNAYLSEITIDAGTLTPVFSRSITKYTVEVPVETATINVSAKKETVNSKISMSGNKTLVYGANEFVFKVTAQDPDVIRYYTVTVTRLSPPLTPTEVIASPTEEITPTPTVEPTEIISNSVSSPTPTTFPDATEVARQFWQLMAYIFIALFLITLIILISVLINKKRNDNNEIKIRRR